MQVIKVLLQSAFKCTAINLLARKKNRYPWTNRNIWKTCIRLSYKKIKCFTSKTIKMQLDLCIQTVKATIYLIRFVLGSFKNYIKSVVLIISYDFIKCENTFSQALLAMHSDQHESTTSKTTLFSKCSNLFSHHLLAKLAKINTLSLVGYWLPLHECCFTGNLICATYCQRLQTLE